MAKKNFLDFEQPIAELESKIEELRFVQDDSAVDISEEIDRLAKKSQQLTKDIYAKLTPWQVSQIARHPQRPYTLDYVGEIFTDWQELHGDRHFADDASIVGGLARFFKILPDEILVVHDELDLLPGQVKLKQGGGHAGHNGLKEIGRAHV